MLVLDRSALARLYRWLSGVGGASIGASLFLGYAGVVLASIGALACLVASLCGGCWLARVAHLRLVRGADWGLLGIAACGTFGGACALLSSPPCYWLYWLALSALLIDAAVSVRGRALRVGVVALVLVGFFLIPARVVRAAAIVPAVETRSIRHARLFIWLGADPNQRKQHEPLLLLAIGAQDVAMSRLLLGHGADPNGRSSAFMASTPALSEAVAMGSPALVQLLLEHGAAPNLANDWGETALGRAARTGQLTCAKLLLSHGADPRHVDRNGQSPADAAREHHYPELESILAR
jgi:Ankyrin repeats (3 copies)